MNDNQQNPQDELTSDEVPKNGLYTFDSVSYTDRTRRVIVVLLLAQQFVITVVMLLVLVEGFREVDVQVVISVLTGCSALTLIGVRWYFK